MSEAIDLPAQEVVGEARNTKGLVGVMMGVWFPASSFGSKLAGYLSGFFVADDPSTLVRLYGGIAAGLLAATAVPAALFPTLRRMTGHVR